MPVLAWILMVTAGGGALAVSSAALFALAARAHWIPALVSYAIGALLGAAFLEILPHALESTRDPPGIMTALLLGLLSFFVLEKLVIWRHHHDHNGHSHAKAMPLGDGGRSGLMILIGNAVHSLVDGVIIAGAFMQSRDLGIVTAIAIFAHAIPQQVGDFVILLHSGYSKATAFSYSLVASLATVAGAATAHFALRDMQQMVPYLLGVACASLIYVAAADLIPSLHRRSGWRAATGQMVLIGLGIGSIWLTEYLLH